MAVTAAMKLLRRIDEFNATNPDSGEPRLEVGIGIHIGPAVVGNIGSQNRIEFTSIGSTVNYASRLEGLCKSLSCSIVASESIGLAGTEGWEQESGVSIRGLAEKQTVWVHRLSAERQRRTDKRTVA
jgi:adenylate cyclase